MGVSAGHSQLPQISPLTHTHTHTLTHTLTHACLNPPLFRDQGLCREGYEPSDLDGVPARREEWSQIPEID